MKDLRLPTQITIPLANRVVRTPVLRIVSRGPGGGTITRGIPPSTIYPTNDGGAVSVMPRWPRVSVGR